MELILNYDVISYIMSLIKPNPIYFLLSKKFYEMRSHYLVLYMTNIGKYLKPNREITNFCLLRYYGIKLKDDMGSYRKYILYFIVNKTRKSTVYPCKNSYHRMLVHKFYEVQGLKHETIIQGTKKVRTCILCKSPNISIRCDDYGEYYCSCNNCDNYDIGYSAANRFVCYTSLPQKVIRITKI